MITPSQQAVIDHILKIWAAAKTYPAGIAGIQPRAIPLIVGRSGSGKSTIAHNLSQILDCPLFNVSAGSWILRCAAERSGTPTLERVEEFIQTKRKGIIFFDELDKFSAESDWMRCVQQELYALTDLDSSRLGWDPHSTSALKASFCFLCAGTWQDLRPPKSIGYGGESPASLNLLEHQRSIPEELLRRTSHPPLFLSSTTHQEFVSALTNIHAELCLDTDINKLAAQAVASSLNFRWLENYVATQLSSKAPEPSQFQLQPHSPKALSQRQPYPTPLVLHTTPTQAETAITAVRTRLTQLENELADAKENSQHPNALQNLDVIEEGITRASDLIQQLRHDMVTLVGEEMKS